MLNNVFKAYLYPITFDGVDFIECRPEESINFFSYSVNIRYFIISDLYVLSFHCSRQTLTTKVIK